MYVSGLVRNGPAHSCGLIRRNDVLLEVNGARVGEGEELANDRDVKARMMELCAVGGTGRRRVRLQRRLRLRSVMAAGASSGADAADLASPSTGSEDQPRAAATAEVAMSALDAHVAGASRNAGGHRRGKTQARGAARAALFGDDQDGTDSRLFSDDEEDGVDTGTVKGNNKGKNGTTSGSGNDRAGGILDFDEASSDDKDTALSGTHVRVIQFKFMRSGWAPSSATRSTGLAASSAEDAGAGAGGTCAVQMNAI